MIEVTRLSFKDNKIKDCFDAIGYESTQFYRNEKFRTYFAEIHCSELTWDYLCDVVAATNCQNYGMRFLIELMQRRLLIASPDILSEIEGILHLFDSKSLSNAHPGAVFCKERIVDELFYHYNNKGNKHRLVYAFMPCTNHYFKELMRSFMEAQRFYVCWHSDVILRPFADSLDEMLDSVKAYTDLNERTFWQQINYYKGVFEEGTSDLNFAIRAVCNFYRWLVNTYPDHNFFVDSFHMNRQLLFSYRLPEIIEKDYHVKTLDPKNPPLGKANVCFIIRNMGHLSTNITDDDFFTVTLEPLQSQFYKDLIIRYLVSAPSVTLITWAGQLGYIRDGLCFLEKLKKEKGYPNPDLKYLNTKEAIFIRNFYYDEKIQLSTMNNKIGAIRRFFDWCKVNNLLTFEDMFPDYLRQYEEPPKTTGHAVPDAELVKLHDCIVEHAENDYLWQLILYIFHLLLDTDFRISQLLHLDVNCIEPSVKAGEYVLRSNTKVTHDVRPHTFVITEATYRLLLETINFTEDVRERCSDPNLQDYIFLYEGTVKSICLMPIKKVSNSLKSACCEAGIPQYTPSNLRDTYMTKSFEYIQRHGKSDIEMGLLSKHKSIDTTKSHYIQQNLEKMLEATYGVDLAGIDDIGADSKVVDTIPDNLRSTEHDVQDGCGKCKSDDCFAKGSVPCLICKDFLTTAEHEKFFIAAIEKIDQAINRTSCRHDVEDLVITKTLYVKFLEAIYKRKEMSNDN